MLKNTNTPDRRKQNRRNPNRYVPVELPNMFLGKGKCQLLMSIWHGDPKQPSVTAVTQIVISESKTEEIVRCEHKRGFSSMSKFGPKTSSQLQAPITHLANIAAVTKKQYYIPVKAFFPPVADPAGVTFTTLNLTVFDRGLKIQKNWNYDQNTRCKL